MKKKILIILFCLLLCTSALAERLVPGGTPLGISIETEGLIVAGFSEIMGKSPAQDAGIRAGDILKSIDDTEINSPEDFANAMKSLSETVELTVLRGGEEKTVKITPTLDENGCRKLGLWLRDGVNGIGTLSFYDPETGLYGALGHSVSDCESGNTVPLREGSIFDAQIVGIIPGERGAPGQLQGCADEGKRLGDIQINCVCGIFGHAELPDAETLETGDIAPGKATVRCTLDGDGVGEYEIQIEKVNEADGRTVAVIRVTDSELLACTGGIVQGMSGSPIIQNGCLVGAVTHVFVNDPATGFAIGIYDMIEAAA